MACGCTSVVSHLLRRPPWKPWSSVETPNRTSFISSSPYRSTLTRRPGPNGPTFKQIGGVVQCSSSSPSMGFSSAASPFSWMRESLSTRRRIEQNEAETTIEAQPGRIKFPSFKLLAGCVLGFAICHGFHTRAALAVAENSIAASSLGIKVATFLRGSGWSDELIVFTVAMLPVLELRGAIPISYWLNIDPIKGYILAVLGNLVPVPLIVLYLEKLSRYWGERSTSAKDFLTWLFERTRKKGGVIEEFEWLGLMLFVAVPFPGTGAWTGAFIAALLGMPFWEAMTANFFGVMLAGFLVNLVVTLGLKYAVAVGVALFVISTFMWNILRSVQKKNKDVS